MNCFQLDRRTVLRGLAAGAATLAIPNLSAAAAAHEQRLSGLFPIAESPFTQDDKLDLDCLSNQVRFCNKAGVPGLVWPQIASSWSTLSEHERLDGAEALLAANKGGNTSLIIGVQIKGNDLQGSLRLARHAAAHGADGIISLPPEGVDNSAILAYYKAIGQTTSLPLFVQTIGDMSTDIVAQMYREIPTMKVVKDEAGDPLARVGDILRETEGKVAIFAGRGVTLMMDEMRLGFTGFCPVVGLSDIFQQAWELWSAGKKRESFDMFGRVLAFNSIRHASQYLLVARGIFKESTTRRPTPGMGAKPAQLTEDDKRVVRQSLETYLKPYLRA